MKKQFFHIVAALALICGVFASAECSLSQAVLISRRTSMT